MVPCSVLLSFFCGTVALGATGDGERCVSDDDSCRASTDSLLQIDGKRRTQPSAVSEMPKVSVWAVGAFGDCTAPAGSLMGKQVRSAKCESVIDENFAGSCEGTPPCTLKSCSCDIFACKEGEVTDEDVVGCVDSPGYHHFEQVGCLPPSADADFLKKESHPTDAEIGEETFDWTCINRKKGKRCHTGLPFYLKEDTESPDACARFCIGRGMDLFGMKGKACRCGASKANEEVWHMKPAPQELTFPWDALTEECTSASIRVFRFTGHYEAGGVPMNLMDTRLQDTEYEDDIVAGEIRPDEMDEDGLPSFDGLEPSMLQQVPTWLKNCFPAQCGPGKAFTERTATAPAGVDPKWIAWAPVRYFFVAGLDDTRKEAFREAARRWRVTTCINLVEVAEAGAQRPVLRVGMFDAGSCYVQGLGYISPTFVTNVNLGWCNSNRYIGNMVHEVGHAIGMNHEQKRPDATVKYPANAADGKGPNLKMYWDKIPAQWTPQYTPDGTSYVGSKRDGDGDPFSGYSPYDFRSIMHYPGGDRYDTIPASEERFTGNRQQLTTGDINQILDMYQCKEKGKDAPPAPPPAPQAPAGGGGGGGADWSVTGNGCQKVGNCIQSNNYPTDYGNDQACDITVTGGNLAVTVEGFNTEGQYDKLTMGGNDYSGTTGPNGAMSGTIQWRSDFSVSAGGWKICRVAPAPAPPPIIGEPGPAGPAGPAGPPGPPR